MKTFCYIIILLASISCDSRNIPQEQEWNKEIKEMNQEKRKDPRNFDETREKELDQREVDSADSAAG